VRKKHKRDATSETELLKGSLIKFRRKCGKPNCHCALKGELHEAWALSFKQAGRTRLVLLPQEEVDRVRQAIAHYRAARRTLSQAAETGLLTLNKRIRQLRRERRQG
jgi:hypothetical protein